MDTKRIEELKNEFNETRAKAKAYLEISNMLTSEIKSFTRRLSEITDEIAELREENENA